VLQSVAECCRVLQCDAACCSACCNVLQCVLQCVLLHLGTMGGDEFADGGQVGTRQHFDGVLAQIKARLALLVRRA